MGSQGVQILESSSILLWPLLMVVNQAFEVSSDKGYNLETVSNLEELAIGRQSLD